MQFFVTLTVGQLTASPADLQTAMTEFVDWVRLGRGHLTMPDSQSALTAIGGEMRLSIEIVPT
jgi:hypothetical protein